MCPVRQNGSYSWSWTNSHNSGSGALTVSFPIDYQREYCWEATRREMPMVDAFVRIAAAELQAARASSIEAQGNRIQFTVNRFRWVGNWNLLTNIDRGVIEITPAAGT